MQQRREKVSTLSLLSVLFDGPKRAQRFKVSSQYESDLTVEYAN